MRDGVRERAVEAFLAEVGARDGRLDVSTVFHAVRRLPYHSSGDRSVEAVLARRAGSCSGKHLLLADLLNAIGVPAAVELVRGDFATPLRTAKGLPSDILAMVEDGIPDIHNVVRAEIDGKPTLLDATWHDATKPFGFRVNDAWAGQADTVVAVDVEAFLGPSADAAADKAALIAAWPVDVQARRRDFLERINAFVADLREGGRA